MDAILRSALSKKKIMEMKNPTILMNENDFEVFKKEIESKTNIVVGDNPTFEGVPVKTGKILEKGTFVIFDNV